MMEKFRFMTLNSNPLFSSRGKRIDNREDVITYCRGEDDHSDDEEVNEICKEAADACLRTIIDHLDEFIEEFLHCTYEEWISDLHPENATGDQIDRRFYVEKSDHRLLWNLYMDKEGRYSYKVAPNRSAVESNRSVPCLVESV